MRAARAFALAAAVASATTLAGCGDGHEYPAGFESQAARGESFIIAKAGKPKVMVVPLDETSTGSARRLGFMAGEFTVPDDFDQMARDEIERLFNGDAA